MIYILLFFFTVELDQGLKVFMWENPLVFKPDLELQEEESHLDVGGACCNSPTEEEKQHRIKSTTVIAPPTMFDWQLESLGNEHEERRRVNCENSTIQTGLFSNCENIVSFHLKKNCSFRFYLF